MAKYHTITNNFSFGEFSPKASGRTDLAEYRSAVSHMENFLVGNAGGAFKRAGMEFLFDLGIDRDVGLSIFKGDDGISFAIIFDPANNDPDSADPFIRIIQLNGTGKGTEATVDQSLYALIYDTVLNYKINTDLDPEGFNTVQIADTIFVVHTSGKQVPFNIHRQGLAAFTISVNFFGVVSKSFQGVKDVFLAFPYQDPNISETSITPSGTMGNITLTSSTDLFDPLHVGGYFKLTHSGTTGVALINEYTSETEVGALVSLGFGAATATTDWQESFWSDFRGWPRSQAFFEQSFYYGGSDGFPSTVWKSLTNNTFHFMARRLAQDQDSSTDESGVNYFGDSTPLDPTSFLVGAKHIRWLTATRTLNLGTDDAEIIGSGGDQILGPESVGFKIQTKHGGSNVDPVIVGFDTVYVSETRRKLRNFRFNENNGSNISQDLTFFAEHISKSGGKDAGFKKLSYSGSEEIIWAVNNNGKLLSCTYRTDSPTIGWAKHTTDGVVVDIGVGPGDDRTDVLYLVVERNGSRYIESVGRPFDGEELDPDSPILVEDIPLFSDSFVQGVLLSATDTFSGLDHLEGNEVVATKDGELLGLFTVSGGDITFPETYPLGTRIVAGLPYTASVRSLPSNSGGEFGTAVGSVKRTDAVTTRLYKTRQIKYKGLDSPFFDKVPLKDLFTGVKELKVSNNPSREMGVEFSSDTPHPCNVLFFTQRGFSNDG